MSARDNLNPAQFADEDPTTHCPDCGAHSGGHVHANGQVLLHRGVAEYGSGKSYTGKTWNNAEDMMKEEGAGGDLDKEYGSWWGSKGLGEFYGNGGKDSGMLVSAWFPEDKVRSGGAAHEGHIVATGTPGTVHEVRVRENDKWKTLPHAPGMKVQP